MGNHSAPQVSNSSNGLTSPPANWLEHYQPFDTGGWQGWIRVDHQVDDLDSILQDPAALFGADRVVRWFKQTRNLLAEVKWQDSAEAAATVVLKSYGSSSLANRLRLRLGEPRAARHWNNAWLLARREINTPIPVFVAIPGGKGRRSGEGAAGQYPQGLIAVEMLHHFIELNQLIPRTPDSRPANPCGDMESLARICGQYVREIHDCNLVHRDLSSYNILVPQDWDGSAGNLRQRFSLVDINRVRDIPPQAMSIKLRIQDLERLYIPDAQLQTYFLAYAAGSDQLTGEWSRFLKYRNGYRKIRETTNPLERAVLKIFTYWPRTG